MPRTIAEGFDNFLITLTPSTTETTAAKNHRASVKDCLDRNFTVNRFFRTGSFGNGTSISGYSDVDYFVSVPANELYSRSSVSLTKIREILDARFPRTGVRVDCPAVCLPFGRDAGELIEITPACFVKTENNHDIFEIPDCCDGWMHSSPDAHNEYVRFFDQKFNGRLKSLIRFIKAWKYFCQVPISSFYLELRVTKYMEDEDWVNYSYDIRNILKFLLEKNLAKIHDPMGISGNISPCSTESKLESALSKLNTAYTRADKALRAAEENNNVKEAFEWWNKLFNNNFSSYYL